MRRLKSRLEWKMTLPKPGKRDTRPERREREKSRLNRLEQLKPTKKEDGESPVVERDGAKDAETGIMDRVTANHNETLVMENAGDRAIWPKIAMLKMLKWWFATNARKRDITEVNVRS